MLIFLYLYMYVCIAHVVWAYIIYMLCNKYIGICKILRVPREDGSGRAKASVFIFEESWNQTKF